MSGSEIRTKRKELGLSMQELATRAGMSWVALQQIETGKTKKPHKLTMRAIESTLIEVANDNDVPSPCNRKEM